ncbi:MAG: VOC family protein [Nocardiaceae bacterium]|nr:VOC family protein [Nocardiaceae bacterium]
MVFWISAFLDFTPDAHDAGSTFWSAATGYDISPERGTQGEFAGLVPPDGDVYLRLQRLHDGPSRVHLDLHVHDVRAAAEHAVSRGAAEISDFSEWIVMRSPTGIVFCFVDDPASKVPAPASWPHRSVADQISLDIPPDSFDAECEFWAAVTNRPLGQSRWFAEFRNLERPADQRIRLLLQRLDDGPAGAHIDFATNDRAAETARHVALGATVAKENDRWTVLHDPSGHPYCITDRDPG